MKRYLRKLRRSKHSKVLSFAGRYKLFSLSLIAALAALILDLVGRDTISHWILIVVCVIAILPLVADMYQDLRHGSYGIDILAITAIVTALLLGQYWAAIIVVLMLTGGKSLEDFAEHRSRSELDALLARAPAKAHVMRGRRIIDVAASAVNPGDRIIIKPGEVVPADAEIIEGTASFDESSLTGESLPQSREVGEQILSGSVNLDGAITARALHTAADSQYQQIVRLVNTARHSKAPFVRMADRYAIPFTMIAFAIAGSVWYISGDPMRFLEVIVVATPCPLILAAPIAIISGMSRASKHGIIVRTGSSLERLAKARTMAFDKTGTLTTGRLHVDDVLTNGKFSASEVLAYAAGVTSGSTHVLGRAALEAAQDKKVKVPKARHITEIAGRGMNATISGKHIIVGRRSLLEKHGVSIPAKYRNGGIKQTATYVAVEGELAGVLTFKDEIRSETPGTLKRLKKLGVKQIEMVTGDNKATAEAVAQELGIDLVTADALPGDKLMAIEAIKLRPVAFVGDGVNDAPVLTAADVGIALGARGSTAASESADLVIMVDDIGHVASSVAIARRTFRIASQSILIGIALSVILMLVFATGKFTAIQGAVIQELVDVVVIFNALRAHLDRY